jgi:hypothetical protein
MRPEAIKTSVPARAAVVNRGSNSNSVLGHQASAIATVDSSASYPQQNYKPAAISSCSETEERMPEGARSSPLPCNSCSELLHQLSNSMTAVLMNAQVVGWKLPPYSHLKRPVRELERNAQRSGELLKQLIRRVQDDGTGFAGSEGSVPGWVQR